MIKHFILTVTFLYFVTLSNAQNNPNFDSLSTLLQHQKEDSNKLETYQNICSKYNRNYPFYAKELEEKMLALSLKLQNKKYMAEAYHLLADNYMNQSDYTNGLANFYKCAAVKEQLKDRAGLAKIYISISQVLYQSKQGVNKSIDYLSKAESLIKESADSSKLSAVYKVYGDIYFEEADYTKALNYYNKGLHLAQQFKDLHWQASLLNEIGLAYREQKNTKMALQYLDSALAVANMVNPINPIRLAYIYSDKGATYMQTGNYAQAFSALSASNDFARQAGNRQTEMENYGSIAHIYEQQKDYKNQADYLTKYYTLKDSLLTTDIQVKITQAEAGYQIEKKNASLARQEAETEKQKRQRNILVYITTGILLLLGALALFYRRIQHKNALLAAQNIQINHQKTDLQNLNSVKDKLFSVISHDLRHPIATIKTYFSLSKDKTLAPEKQEQYNTQLQQTVNQTGAMMDNLLVWAQTQINNKPAILSKINIVDVAENVVADVAAQAQMKNISFENNWKAANALSNHAVLEIALRNVITNAIKYSNPGSLIQLSSNAHNGQVYLTIADKGIGMSTQQIDEIINQQGESRPGTQGEKGSGMGLLLVLQLLKQINGSLQIESKPGEGSQFIIMLPSLVN